MAEWRQTMALGNNLSDDAMNLAERGELVKATQLMRVANKLRHEALIEKHSPKQEEGQVEERG